MSSYGNMGCPDKLAAFMKIVSLAEKSVDAVGVHFIVEHDPLTKEKFKLSKEDIKNLKYDNIDIYLNDKLLVQWWDIISAAVIFELWGLCPLTEKVWTRRPKHIIVPL